MSDIRLHPEHGLNPTIAVCFLCGKEKNELALLGDGYRGKAPMHAFIDKEPCDTCKEYAEIGIVLIEVEDNSGRENPDRTGSLSVVTEDGFERMFGHKPTQRFAFLEKSAWDKIGLPRENVDNRKPKDEAAEVSEDIDD